MPSAADAKVRANTRLAAISWPDLRALYRAALAVVIVPCPIRR
jgi:hypothetical protein